MATIKTDLICNLNQPVNVTYLHGNLFSQDNAGNTINVFVMDNGEPATIGGTVSANVIRSDGQTVAVSGAIEGNKAYVILPQACYAVPGVVHIIIKLTQNTTITTIAAIVANVYMSTTDAVIDPGQVIPSIQALMAQIEEAVDSIPTDYTGLLHTIAADYSSSKTYKVGDYAWESGVLKRCIVPITTAETYTAAHWTNAVIGDDLSALKSAINGGTFTFTKTYMSDNRYETNKIYDAQSSNIGKSFSQITKASTTGGFSYILDVTLSKEVSFPIGTPSASTIYGNLAFDENDICVWTWMNRDTTKTAGDVITVTLPKNAVKLLMAFPGSLNNLGTEYHVTLVRKNALSEIGENIKSIDALENGFDFYASYPNTIHVNASATHSATLDKTDVDISNGDYFAIFFSRNYTNAIQFYGFDEANNGHLLASRNDKSGYKIITAPANLKSIGITVSATSNADDYTFVVVTEEQALFRLLSDLSEVTETANSTAASIGDIHRKSFSVNANSTHSSSSDKMSVAIPANTPFVLGFDVTSANNTALAMLYAVKEDDTTSNFANIYPGLTVNKLFKYTLGYAVKAIGVYYSNTVSEAVTVSTLVAIGQIDTDAIYDNQHDVLFVEELNADMPRTVFAKYADTTNAETFVFYSDPHYLLNNGGMTTGRINQLDCEWLRQLKTKADAINAQAVICGGDLINAEQTDAELCYKLGMHHAIARKLFGEKYHLALGNHDTRFDATSQSILDNLLFAEEDTQKAYYSVKTPKTKYYFLNTGTDQNGAMTAYRWEQITWLAEHLLTDTEANMAISMHIVSIDASGNPDNFGSAITPMATNVFSLVNAYNAKGTVTLNGVSYNFATATGKIRFILCGHTHYDTVYIATGDIPVICIDDATGIGTATKLVMYSCLADYENGKLYACRDGATTVEVTLA